MSAAPHWLQETLRAFGESLGLKTFALNASGVAGLALGLGGGLAGAGDADAQVELAKVEGEPTRGAQVGD